MKEFKEANIVVDGTPLSIGEAMTVRVALATFASELSDTGLGDDERGKAMTSSYITNVRNIMSYMVIK